MRMRSSSLHLLVCCLFQKTLRSPRLILLEVRAVLSDRLQLHDLGGVLADVGPPVTTPPRRLRGRHRLPGVLPVAGPLVLEAVTAAHVLPVARVRRVVEPGHDRHPATADVGVHREDDRALRLVALEAADVHALPARELADEALYSWHGAPPSSSQRGSS